MTTDLERGIKSPEVAEAQLAWAEFLESQLMYVGCTLNADTTRRIADMLRSDSLPWGISKGE